MRKLEERGIELDEEIVKLEMRRVFDLNVGISRIVDLETDVQLRKAIEVIKSGMIARALSSEEPIKL